MKTRKSSHEVLCKSTSKSFYCQVKSQTQTQVTLRSNLYIVADIKSDASTAGWQDTFTARADACRDGRATQGGLW